jgi:hypothetical protein
MTAHIEAHAHVGPRLIARERREELDPRLRRLRYGFGRYRALAARAELVDEPAAFAARELLGRQVVGVYGLRGAPDVRIALRHTTFDLYGLDQVFRQRSLLSAAHRGSSISAPTLDSPRRGFCASTPAPG